MSILGLYRIYFFPVWPEPDFAGFGITNPTGAGTGAGFQNDCNFTNLMCKNITNVRVICVFDYFFDFFLCSNYRYIIYMHLRSNLCHSTYYVSKKYLNNLTFNIPKIDFSNPAKLSGSGGIFARAGFLPDLEKVSDSGRSRSQNPVQP